MTRLPARYVLRPLHRAAWWLVPGLVITGVLGVINAVESFAGGPGSGGWHAALDPGALLFAAQLGMAAFAPGAVVEAVTTRAGVRAPLRLAAFAALLVGGGLALHGLTLLIDMDLWGLNVAIYEYEVVPVTLVGAVVSIATAARAEVLAARAAGSSGRTAGNLARAVGSPARTAGDPRRTRIVHDASTPGAPGAPGERDLSAPRG
ncbi:hypothetical protein BRM1_06950 [Brevibacterium sp. BRM-1]|uniref:hypothetical protein n=1 Tax=Brevibacterium sp. BRM-1 TaxID=2999062 RepID=UPI00227EB6FC|nr:hypothetical protein [Brevibacterium sp. BRM-1]WAL41564.1 hypothetical protein BRM1_06950 [Brevibacterium sp. BRM-1]